MKVILTKCWTNMIDWIINISLQLFLAGILGAVSWTTTEFFLYVRSTVFFSYRNEQIKQINLENCWKKHFQIKY